MFGFSFCPSAVTVVAVVVVDGVVDVAIDALVVFAGAVDVVVVVVDVKVVFLLLLFLYHDC